MKRGRGVVRRKERWEWRKAREWEEAPFKVNGIQKHSPIIFACHASETDLIKTT